MIGRRGPWMTFVAAAALGAASPAPASADDWKPWRLRDAVGAPEWLDFGLAHRLRFEHMNDDYRAASDADATALVLRTLLSARLTVDPVFLALEGEDSRAYATDDAPLNTSTVDAVELLQAHLGLQLSGLFADGDAMLARAGRMTIDVGSRRLVARNGFRNTINGFTGVDLQWTSSTKHVLRAFFAVPVTRLPSDAASVRDNEIELDEENTDTLFGGAFYGSPALLADAKLELFVFVLHEGDGDVETTDRRFVTPGLRAFAEPAPARMDWQAESVLQVGKSRATNDAMDTTDLDHLAFFARGEVGYTIDVPWTPRLVAQYDYASGDGDPNDDRNGRFDTLYGARRFDFGPTGLYGPFARANLHTPGLRVEVDPHERVEAFVAYRLYWLASDSDAWTTAPLSDPTGSSGTFLGHQPEACLRWHILPKNVDLDVGLAHHFRAGFAADAPGGRDGSTTFVYAELTGTL